MTTPENITDLKDNQVFVFGSNLNGNHIGGAALLAKEKFGAVDGIGEGLVGQSYAFPTLDRKMKKVSEKALLASKELLYKSAGEHKDKQFLVTKLGCGIAGFSEDVMKDIFKGPKPDNVILPPFWNVVRGYKAFQEGLVCRGMQYEFGKDYTYKGNIALCSSGFHFCKGLGGVYEYYPFGSVVCEVEAFGEVIDEEGGNKSVTNGLRLVRMLNPVEAKGNKGPDNTGYLNSGNWNSGNLNSGNWNSGDRNSGDRNSGDRNSGNWNSGNWNSGNWNSGKWNSGNWNSGDLNSGNWNSGNWNSGDRNSGYFNSEIPDEIMVFNKKCKWDKWERADKPYCMYFNLTEWVDFSNMTEEERKNHPSCTTTGGYLKTYSYKEAWKKALENISQEDVKRIRNLPNFSSKVFEEITGVKL